MPAVSELKPCPFCGGEADFYKYHFAENNAPFWFVQCLKCGTSSWYYDTKAKAAEAWNLRDNFMRKLISLW